MNKFFDEEDSDDDKAAAELEKKRKDEEAKKKGKAGGIFNLGIDSSEEEEDFGKSLAFNQNTLANKKKVNAFLADEEEDDYKVGSVAPKPAMPTAAIFGQPMPRAPAPVPPQQQQ